jgi:mono/diheme cytochrome c family protein
MKFRFALFSAFIALLISSCSMTLARDVTPPPGAVQNAQVQPTSGPVYPAQAPDLQNGAAIYAQECAPCHGTQGLGDGTMSAQLASQNITIPALGSPEKANAAKPADWFSTVTLGNMQKFMPPFSNKLSDQERWDVVAYAFSLSATPNLISQGEQLFKENCANCPTDLFTDQERMAALSTNDLATLLAEGGEGIPALGNDLSQDELQAVAVYLRTLTFGMPSLAAEQMQSESPSTEVAGAESPSMEGTPGEAQQTESTSEAAAIPSKVGPVSGAVVTGGDGDIPSGVTVTLHGFEHSTDQNNPPKEVLTEKTETDETGTFLFEDVDLPEGRIFLVEASYQGILFQSEPIVSKAGVTKLTIPDIKVYETTTDSGGLVVEQLHLSFDMAVEGGVQVFELYTISNTTNKAFVFATDGTSLPFMPLPEGATSVGLELSQDSAPILPTESGEFALPPSDKFYSLIAYFNLPYDKSLELKQPLVLPVNSALVIVPEGIKVKSDQLTDAGIRQTQQGFKIQTYSASGLSAGLPLEMTLSGRVKSTASTDSRQTLLIGAGAFGMVLILAGVWMFFRDRGKPDEDEFEHDEGNEDEFETAEEVMDAIIALDDLYRAKNIPEEAYQQRRAELKERLKELA